VIALVEPDHSKPMEPIYRSLKEYLWPGFEKLEQVVNSGLGVSGIPTGFSDLDALTAGWQRGDLIVVSGAPAMGKSSAALGFGLTAAIGSQANVGLVSLEILPEQLALRLICTEGRVSLNRMRRGRLDDDEYARLALAGGQLNAASIFVLHAARITVDELCQETRELDAEKPLDMLVVDTLNLLRVEGFAPPAVNREQEVGIIARELKALALELQIPIIATASLSRAVEQRIDKRPQLPDLRDSGDVENSADIVIFVYRPEYYFGPVDKYGGSLEGRTELIVGKHRNGPTGIVPAIFSHDYVAFRPYA
jgi:replicative DNA helicase